MTESRDNQAVVTDVESAGRSQEDIEVAANTTGSMKVIITKQKEEGEGSEIINKEEMGYGGDGKKLPRLNEPSEEGGTDELRVGTVLNEGSEVNLLQEGAGSLADS